MIKNIVEFTADEMEQKMEQKRRGELLIEVLALRKKSNGRVDTTWGDKTALGLYHTLKRIIDEGK